MYKISIVITTAAFILSGVYACVAQPRFKNNVSKQKNLVKSAENDVALNFTVVWDGTIQTEQKVDLKIEWLSHNPNKIVINNISRSNNNDENDAKNLRFFANIFRSSVITCRTLCIHF